MGVKGIDVVNELSRSWREGNTVNVPNKIIADDYSFALAA